MARERIKKSPKPEIGLGLFLKTGGPGFEPRLGAPEAPVLPLHNPPMKLRIILGKPDSDKPGFLARRPGHIPAAQKMNMQVKNRLPRLWTVIDD